MSLCDSNIRGRNHLPPLISNPKAYSIRKSARNNYSTSRKSAVENRHPRSVQIRKKPSKSTLPKPPELGFCLDDIQLGRCIGRGKGGRVVLGTVLQKDYAVKIISKELLKYANIEAQILQKLSSRFIVRYFGRLEDEQNVYLVIEYIKGSDLFHFMIKQRIRLPKVVNFVAQVLEGLNALHSQGIVYRDMKPENLMINENEDVKIVDFGLSKVINGERTNTICGSPEYMAPEVIRKNAYGYSVDFWGLGVLIFELLNGYFVNRHPPFQGESYPEICKAILGGTVEFTRSIDPLSKDIIRKLLNTEPAFRLGCLQNKIVDVKQHRFFKDVDWDALGGI